MSTSPDKTIHSERRFSIVVESLKTLRAIHRTLMFLCATVIVVALFPYTQNDYSGAMAELKAVARIDLEQFINDSYASLNALTRNSEKNMAFAEACHFSIRYELNKIGLDVVKFDPSRFGHHVCIAAFDVKQIEGLQSSRAMGRYRRLIAKDFGVEWVWFNPSRLAEAFLEEFRDPNKIPREFWGYPAEASLIMNSPVYCPTGTKNFSGAVKLVLFFTEPKLGTFQAEVENPPVWKVEKFTETGFQRWLDRQGLLERIVERYGSLDMPYKEELLFPNLCPLWSLVVDKTPEEAKRMLMEKASESRREVLLLGVPLDIGMVVFAAPIVTAIIYLFFLSYVVHLNRIHDGAREMLHEFPWLLLFPGVWYSRASKALVFLPSLALILLVIRNLWIGDWTLGPGIVFTISSVILAFYCLREIKNMRKKD